MKQQEKQNVKQQVKQIVKKQEKQIEKQQGKQIVKHQGKQMLETGLLPKVLKVSRSIDNSRRKETGFKLLNAGAFDSFRVSYHDNERVSCHDNNWVAECAVENG